MLSKSLILSLLPLLTFALSVPDIISVFGQATDLTGASNVLPQFTFTIVTNTTHALVSLNQTAPSYKVGWMATAVGTAMANADFLITWPNAATATGPASVPWTISHRQSSNGENQPVIASTAATTSTKNFFTYLPALSSTDPASPFTVVSYLRLLTMPADYPTISTFKSISRGKTSFIYASSTFQPQNVAENAILTQHDQAHAVTVLDLSTPISLGAAAAPAAAVSSSGAVSSAQGTATGSAAAASSTTGAAAAPIGIVAQTDNARTKRDMILIAHATVGSLALLLFSPIGILVARFFRNYHWFPIHAAIQLTAAALVVAGFGLGYYASSPDHFDDNHKRGGLALLIIILIQVLLGSVMHLIVKPRAPSPTSRFPTLSNKSPIRLIHIALGLAITVAGFAQTRSGLDEWYEYSDAGTLVPKSVSVIMWIVIVLVAILYVLGWVGEGMGRLSHKREDVLEGGEREKNGSGSLETESN